MDKIVGQALRKERESRGVSLADIASETRISTHFLQALEDEEFDLFPGKFYIHYYIKNYLHACGADETAFFNTYQQHLQNILKKGDDPPPDQYLHKMNYARFRRNRTLVLAVLLAAALGVLAFLLLGPPRWLDRLLTRRPAMSLTVPAFSSQLLRSEAESCLTQAPVIARLEFEAPSWLQLWRGSEKVAERIFRKGEDVTLQGYQLILVIANPPALRLRLNGRDVSYFRRSAAALKLAVDPGNLQEIYLR